MGGEVWTTLIETGKAKGEGWENLVGKCGSFFSSSAFSVFKHLPRELPRMSSSPPRSPFFSSTPTPFPSHYPFRLRSSALFVKSAQI